ncbi:MAG TPA: carboxypeptidase-like regulatory domain-containing protein, partial [Bacteroidales bacterium]|nr:carboxypeptidase-like regulatory domain-containing protein [Bacteroidales bacterium]
MKKNFKRGEGLHWNLLHKIILIMRLSLFILITTTFSLFATGTYSQSARVSVEFNNVPIKEVLKAIESSSDFFFIYNNELIDVERRVNISAKDQKISDVLKTVFKEGEVDVAVIDRKIILAPAYMKNQKLTVSGVVTDATTKEPLPGVNILVEGTTVGAIADIDGKYSLELPSANAVLIFSFVGYNSERIQVTDQSVINVSLIPDITNLNEVVVTALGIKKEAKSLSYNVQQLSGSDVNKVSDANFVNNLTGKVAGVTINSSSSGVGGASRVVMRGVKSISGNNNALYVIDGIPMPNMSSEQPEGVFAGAGQTGDGVSNLNPDDIESVSVLSGPSAAALYGSSASNGVILITTKKGQKDKLSLTLANSTTFSNPLILPEFQNTYGQSETGSYYSWGEKLAKPSNYDPADFFQTGINLSNTVSLSTGNEKNQTYASVGSVNAQGIVHNNDFDRYNFSVRNTSSFLKDKMT